MRIIKENSWWVLVADGIGEELCRAENCSFDDAVDAFVANMPELMVELDELKCEDFCGNGTNRTKYQRERLGTSPGKKRGSGMRFRELMMQGKTNAECLAVIRGEFPDSKATLSDAAFNRARLRKSPDGFREDGSKK